MEGPMIPWGLFSLVSAAANAGYLFGLKRLSGENNEDLVAAGSFLSASVVLLILEILSGGLHAPGPFLLPAIAGTTVLNALALLLVFRAFRHTDISIAAPMLSFTPAVLLLISPLFEGSNLTARGIVGVVTIVAGSYVLSAPRCGGSLMAPFIALKEDHGVRAMLVVAVLYAFSSQLDRAVVQQSDPFLGSSMVTMLLGLFFLIRAGPRRLSGPVPPHPWHTRVKIAVIGLLLAIEIAGLNAAFLFAPVPYAIALKRTSGVFSVLLGCLLGGEKGLFQRAVGSGVMAIGAAVVVLSVP